MADNVAGASAALLLPERCRPDSRPEVVDVVDGGVEASLRTSRYNKESSRHQSFSGSGGQK